MPEIERRIQQLPGKKASEIQSIRFDKRQWTPRQAEGWLAAHHYTPLKLDVTPHQLRYRIKPPERYKRMVAFTPKTKTGASSGKGVSFILGFR